MRITKAGIFAAVAAGLMLYSGAHAIADAGHYTGARPATVHATTVHAGHRAPVTPAGPGGPVVSGKHRPHLRLYMMRRVLHPRRVLRRRRLFGRRRFGWHPLWWLGF